MADRNKLSGAPFYGGMPAIILKVILGHSNSLSRCRRASVYDRLRVIPKLTESA